MIRLVRHVQPDFDNDPQPPMCFHAASGLGFGEFGPPPSTRGFESQGRAAPLSPSRPSAVGRVAGHLVPLDRGLGNRPAQNCGALASGRIPALLALAIAPSRRPAANRSEIDPLDPANVDREPTWHWKGTVPFRVQWRRRIWVRSSRCRWWAVFTIGTPEGPRDVSHLGIDCRLAAKPARAKRPRDRSTGASLGSWRRRRSSTIVELFQLIIAPITLAPPLRCHRKRAP